MNQSHKALRYRPSGVAPSSRHEAQIGAGFSKGPNFSVLNLLVALVHDKDTVVRFDEHAYVRAAPRRIDPYIVDTGARYVIANGLRSSGQAFNFSLKGDQTVMVQYPGGSPKLMLVMRTYNVIRNGKLVTPVLEARLGLNLFTLLREEGRLSMEGLLVERDAAHQPNAFYNISLEGMPLVSASWARPRQQRLVDLLKQEADLKTARSVLETLAPTLPISVPREAAPPVTERSLPYYRSATSRQEDPIDVVDAHEITYTLPDYVPTAYVYGGARDRASANEELRRLRHELVILRFKIRSICFAIESCKNGTPIVWSDPLPTRRGKYPCTKRQIVLNGVTILRTEKVVQKPR